MGSSSGRSDLSLGAVAAAAGNRVAVVIDYLDRLNGDVFLIRPAADRVDAADLAAGIVDIGVVCAGGDGRVGVEVI